MGRMRDAAQPSEIAAQVSLLLLLVFSFLFFFCLGGRRRAGWPKVRAYKKKIHTLGRCCSLGSEACLKCLSISGRRLLHAIAGKFFTRKAMSTARRRSGVNFPRAQIILDYEQSPAAGGSELNFPQLLLLQSRPEVAV